MNYRHGFHAGNFADLLKHTALCELLRLLTAKDKKLFVLDTHAGAGGYDLGGELAARTREAEAGILRLMAAPKAGVPAAVARYFAAVAAYDRKFVVNKSAIRHYPGSPRLVRQGLRPGDRLVACELHPREMLALKREFAGDRAVEVREEIGLRVREVAADGHEAVGGSSPRGELGGGPRRLRHEARAGAELAIAAARAAATRHARALASKRSRCTRARRGSQVFRRERTETSRRSITRSSIA